MHVYRTFWEGLETALMTRGSSPGIVVSDSVPLGISGASPNIATPSGHQILATSDSAVIAGLEAAALPLGTLPVRSTVMSAASALPATTLSSLISSIPQAMVSAGNQVGRAHTAAVRAAGETAGNLLRQYLMDPHVIQVRSVLSRTPSIPSSVGSFGSAVSLESIEGAIRGSASVASISAGGSVSRSFGSRVLSASWNALARPLLRRRRQVHGKSSKVRWKRKNHNYASSPRCRRK